MYMHACVRACVRVCVYRFEGQVLILWMVWFVVCTSVFVLVVATSPLPSALTLSSQGMARMCCDPRRNVRHMAISYLQRALLAHDLQRLSPNEWEACFLEVRGTFWGGEGVHWHGRGVHRMVVGYVGG